MAATGPAASSVSGTACRRRARSRPTSRLEPRPLQMNPLALPRGPGRPGLSSCSSSLRATQTDGVRLCRHCPLALWRSRRCRSRKLRIGNRGSHHLNRSRSSRVGKRRRRTRTPKRQRNRGAKSTSSSRSPKKCSLHPPRPPPPYPSNHGPYQRLARSAHRARLKSAIGVLTRCRSALSKAIALPVPISRNTIWVICRPWRYGGNLRIPISIFWSPLGVSRASDPRSRPGIAVGHRATWRFGCVQ